MGAKQAKLKSETVEELIQSTSFSEHEIQLWYRGFLKECPSGQLTIHDFQRLYCALFSASSPESYGDPVPFARLVFRAFDTNGDGIVEFRDIINILSVTRTTNDEKQRLQWAFQVYDLDGDGYISRSEMLQVVKAIYTLIGPSVVTREMSVEEASAEARTQALFAVMDTDGDERISFEDFVTAVKADSELLALLRGPTPEMQPQIAVPVNKMEDSQNGLN